jgi:SAM-dependent methyltransferase
MATWCFQYQHRTFTPLTVCQLRARSLRSKPSAGAGTYESRTAAGTVSLSSVPDPTVCPAAGHPDIRWLGLEPDPGRRRVLAAAAAAHGQDAPLIAAAAEQIPLADASVDSVAATLVLCSVADQDQVLAEVRRVLRPGGRFAFFEHVAAPRGTWSRRLQRCVSPVTRRLDAGRDPARETWRAIRAAGFREVHARWYSRRALLGIYSPCLGGVAHV